MPQKRKTRPQRGGDYPRYHPSSPAPRGTGLARSYCGPCALTGAPARTYPPGGCRARYPARASARELRGHLPAPPATGSHLTRLAPSRAGAVLLPILAVFPFRFRRARRFYAGRNSLSRREHRFLRSIAPQGERARARGAAHVRGCARDGGADRCSTVHLFGPAPALTETYISGTLSSGKAGAVAEARMGGVFP